MNFLHRMTGNLCSNIKQEMTKSHCFERHTMLMEWALMCFSITAETKEMLHSALGSSGSFLESKERGSSYLHSHYYTVQHCFTDVQECIVSAV